MSVEVVVIGSDAGVERVSDYRLILEWVSMRDGLETLPGLSRKLLTAYGGTEAVWRRRVRELCRGGALRHEISPRAQQRKRTRRLFVVDGVEIADALRRALPPRSVPSRARACGLVPLAAPPATDPRALADSPARSMRVNVHTGEPITARSSAPTRADEAAAAEISDAEWWAMSPAMQRYADYPRAVRQARRSGTYGQVTPGADRHGLRTTRPDGSPPDISQPRAHMFD